MSAAPRPDVTVVVPLKDESDTFPELLHRIDRSLRAIDLDYEVVVVDDGSRADQLALLRDAGASRPVRVVALTRSGGQLAALARGLAESSGTVVVTMDGDLQDPPEEIPRLLAGLAAGAQVAKGRRRRLQAAWWRRAGSRVTTLAAGRMVGVRLQDYGGQFNAYDRSAVDALLDAWRNGMPLIALACHLGLRVDEVLVERDRRRVGRSRYKLPELVGIATDLTIHFGTTRRRLSVGAAALFAGGAAVAGGVGGRRGLGHPVLRLGGATTMALSVLFAVRVADRRSDAPPYSGRGPTAR